MRNKIGIFVLVIFVIGAIIVFVNFKNVPNPAPRGAAAGNAPSTGTYTLADVAKHNSASSCWTAINGGVYDLTNWINQHPGGPDAILSICGIDGSSAFNAQHGGEREPAQVLATFKIGALAK